MTSSPDWPTVAISWVFSTVTVVVIYACFKGFLHLRRKHRKPPPDAGTSTHTPRDRNRLPPSAADADEAERGGLLATYIKHPSKTKSGAAGDCPTNSTLTKTTTCPPSTDRRKQDDVSRWCSDHGLPESLVYALRDQGFTTMAALDALRPEDLEGNPPTLDVTSTALKVQLRQVLRKIHGQPQAQPQTQPQTQPQSRDAVNSCSKGGLLSSSSSSSSASKKQRQFADSQSRMNSSDSGIVSPQQSPYETSAEVFDNGSKDIDGHNSTPYRNDSNDRWRLRSSPKTPSKKKKVPTATLR